MSTVTCRSSLTAIRIDINGLPHIHVQRADFRGFQSWHSRAENLHAIEISLEGSEPMLIEHADRATWESILKALDGAFF